VVVDERVGPLEAIQRSWDMTRGSAMDLFMLFLLLLGLNLACAPASSANTTWPSCANTWPT
jgi:hypothetical protein